MTTTRAAQAAPPAPAPTGLSPDGFGAPPRPRPTRNVAGILLGVILVVFCAVGVAAFTSSVGHRRSVLVVARPVSAGSILQDADLGEARLPPDPALQTVPAARRSEVVGRVVGVNLAAGTLLAMGELAPGPHVDPSHAIVGLALKAGQFPAGLKPLDVVIVVEAGPPSSAGPTDALVLVDSAQVTSAQAAGDGQTTLVSVLVPRSAAPAIAGGGARNQISLVLIGAPK